METMYKTFDEWSRLGYKIIKGSKAVWVNDKPVFNLDQVTKITGKRVYYDGDSDYDEEDSIYYYLAPNHW